MKWHPTAPAEDFSFFDVRVVRESGAPIDGLIYFPHPETKPEHFQKPDVLELLLPFIDELSQESELSIAIPSTQMIID